jgi:glycosidase
MDEFHIDGIRFDAADCVDFGFFKQIRHFCKSKNPDFWLMGEIIHGDYNRWANPEMLDSVTNYECHKGIYSSHNDKNYWEINYSINRQSGNGGIYKNINLYNFVDNHDVDRLASKLSDARYRKLCYTLLYGMPGIPSVYYGSEYGVEGRHENNSDDGLRPCLDLAQLEQTGDRDLYRHIVKLGRIYKAYPELRMGIFETINVQNRQLLFRREYDGHNVYVALNLDDQPYGLHFRPAFGAMVDVLTGTAIPVQDGNAFVEMPPFSSMIFVEDDIVNGIELPEAEAIVVPEETPVVIGGTYRHYKGGEYVVTALARHTETNEELVVYQNTATGEVWARPKTIFTGDVNGEKRFVKLA